MSLKDKSSRIVEEAPEGAGVEKHQTPQTKVSGIKEYEGVKAGSTAVPNNEEHIVNNEEHIARQ